MSSTRKARAERGTDFYETPEWCVRAVLPHLPRGPVLDPCCGRGAILRVAYNEWALDNAFGIELVEEHALAARAAGFIVEQGDSLAPATEWPAGYGTTIVMNPPFMHAQAFVETALSYARDTGGTVAALLRLGFLEGRARAELHAKHPADVLVLSRRPSFTGKGTDSSAYGWFVWGPGRGGRWQILEREAPAADVADDEPPASEVTP